MENKLANTGVVVSPKSENNYAVCASMPIQNSFPDSFRIKTPPVRKHNQGSWSTCVDQAITEALEIFNMVQYGKKTKMSVASSTINRLPENSSWGLDKGAVPIEILLNTQKYGCCEEFVFNEQGDWINFKQRVIDKQLPTKAMTDNAKNFKIGQVLEARTREEKLTALMNPKAVCVGTIMIMKDFVGGYNKHYDYLPQSEIVGAHCILYTGFVKKDSIMYLEFYNSWGEYNGEIGGYSYIPVDSKTVLDMFVLYDTDETLPLPIDPTLCREYRVLIKDAGQKLFKTKDLTKPIVARLLQEGFKNYAVVEDKVNKGFYIQVGAFLDEDLANARMKALNDKFIFNVSVLGVK